MNSLHENHSDPSDESALQAEFEATFSLTPPANIGNVWSELLARLAKSATSENVPLLCSLLRQYKDWEGIVEKPELWQIHLAFSKALPAFPPKSLHYFWKQLDKDKSPQHPSLEYGLEVLSAEHAIEHLIEGLATCKSHTSRLAIVEALEKVGNEYALPALAQLYRQAGHDDWTLARYVARAFRAILYRTSESDAMSLLRASNMPASELLHAMSAPEYDVSNLLQIPQEESNTNENLR